MTDIQIDYTGTSDVWLPEGNVRIVKTTNNQVFNDSVYLNSQENRDVLDDLTRRGLVTWDTLPTGYVVSLDANGQPDLVLSGSVLATFDATRALSADNTSADLDIAAPGAGKKPYLKALEASLTGSTGVAAVTVTSDPAGTPEVLWRGNVTCIGGPISIKFDPPLKPAVANKILRTTVGAAGAGSVSTCNVHGYTK